MFPVILYRRTCNASADLSKQYIIIVLSVKTGDGLAIEVILLGDINIDILMAIELYPEPDGDAMASQVTLQVGGSVTNTAMVLAKLGVGVSLLGCIGADLWAEMALHALEELGINVDGVSQDQRYSTGLIFIPVTRRGERTMFSYRGANTHITPEQITERALAGARWLHLSGYNFLDSPQREAAWRLAELARAAGLAISMDVGMEPALKASAEIERLLPGLDLLVLGFEEAHHLIGAVSEEDAIDRLLARGVRCIGFKLGKQGCMVAESDENAKVQRFELPAYSLPLADTTGAGDAFCAGMIFSRLHGLSLPSSGLLANSLGGLATTVWGAGPALPGALEAKKLIRNAKEFPDLSDSLIWSNEALSALDFVSPGLNNRSVDE
jgi:ribokinase